MGGCGKEHCLSEKDCNCVWTPNGLIKPYPVATAGQVGSSDLLIDRASGQQLDPTGSQLAPLIARADRNHVSGGVCNIGNMMRNSCDGCYLYNTCHLTAK